MTAHAQEPAPVQVLSRKSRICATCAAWRLTRAARGQCRAEPPRVARSRRRRPVGRWPVTLATDWCRRHEPASVCPLCGRPLEILEEIEVDGVVAITPRCFRCMHKGS